MRHLVIPHFFPAEKSGQKSAPVKSLFSSLTVRLREMLKLAYAQTGCISFSVNACSFGAFHRDVSSAFPLFRREEKREYEKILCSKIGGGWKNLFSLMLYFSMKNVILKD